MQKGSQSIFYWIERGIVNLEFDRIRFVPPNQATIQLAVSQLNLRRFFAFHFFRQNQPGCDLLKIEFFVFQLACVKPETIYFDSLHLHPISEQIDQFNFGADINVVESRQRLLVLDKPNAAQANSFATFEFCLVDATET